MFQPEDPPFDFEAEFREPEEDEFAKYAEPANENIGTDKLTKITFEHPDTQYFNGLQDNIRGVAQLCRALQQEETKHIVQLNLKLNAEHKGEQPNPPLPEENEILENVRKFRKNRIHARALLKELLEEKQNFLEALQIKKEEQAYGARKLAKINMLLNHTSKDKKEQGAFLKMYQQANKTEDFTSYYWFTLLLQVFFLIAFIWIINYSNGFNSLHERGVSLRADDNYSYLIHIALMVFLGFGYLGSYMWKFGFGASGHSFLLSAWIFQVGWLVLALWENLHAHPTENWSQYPATLGNTIQVLYVCATCVITYGALVGKVTIFETLFIGTLEAFLYGLNRFVLKEIGVVDPGGSLTIHLFGAAFALGVLILLPKTLSPDFGKDVVRVNYSQTIKFLSHSNSAQNGLKSVYHSDFVALFATVLLWILFPSFNAATAPSGSQHRVIINTLVSSAAAALFSFFISRSLLRKYVNIKHIQSGSLAGAIAMGCAHSVIIEPGSAAVVGLASAAVVIFGFVWVQKWFEGSAPLKIFDTRGVIILHGFSGLIGAFASILATWHVKNEAFGQNMDELLTQGTPNQAAFQGAGILITIGIAFGTGLFISWIIYFARKKLTHPNIYTVYNDRREWVVSAGFPDFQDEMNP